jgi:hypothetical protein
VRRKIDFWQFQTVEICQPDISKPRQVVHYVRRTGVTGGQIRGLNMRKATILLAAIFAVGITSGADAAKKKAAPAKPDPAVAATQNSMNFITAALQPWKPAAPAPAAKSKGKKKKM